MLPANDDALYSGLAQHQISALAHRESKDQRLIEAWPRATKADRSRFQLLKRAYVEARYSPHYSITAEELETLMVSVKRLRDLVGQVCQEWLDMLRKRAEDRA